MLNILNLPAPLFISSLNALFDSRKDLVNISERCKELDESIENFLSGLREFPAQKWRSICEGIEPSPIMLAAATHCADFDWKDFDGLIAAQDWRAEPLNEAGVAASFSQFTPFDPDALTLSQIAQLEFNPKTISFILAALDRCPILDLNVATLARVEAGIAAFLAWFMARDGFSSEGEAALFEWVKRPERSLRFWAGFALLLRMPDFWDQRARLESVIDDDPIRQRLYGAFAQALEDGPYSANEFQIELAEINEGPCAMRWIRALRFAAFCENAPLVDPTARALFRAQAAENLL